MSAELIVLSVGAAAAALICDQGTFPDELTGVEVARSTGTAHEMFLGAPGQPLTEAVRQKAVP